MKYIVTDNAVNMRSAFLTAFPVETSEQPDSECDLLHENQNMEDFLSLNTEIETEVQESLDICSKIRLSCFAHSLRLVVGDGPIEALALSKPIAKASLLFSLLHKSTVFKELFEAKFGNKRSIPAVIVTLWISTLR